MAEKLYFKQLLSGVDFAPDDLLASQMVNFSYLVGDFETREAVAIDPAYDIAKIAQILEEDEMQLTGVLATHYHPDHVGGDMMGHQIEGVVEVCERFDVPIHANKAELPWIVRATGIASTSIVEHESADILKVGRQEIELIHTPGHTPGSQCFYVEGRLIAGDTLFLNGCGRTDLPGGDPDEMYISIHQRLAKISDDTILFPGHLYSPDPQASMGQVRQGNYVFRLNTKDAWMQMFNA